MVNDFNFKELRDKIGPLMLRQQVEGSFADDIFIKLDGNRIFQTADQITATYAKLIDNAEFELRFVDDTINQWYEKDERTGKIIGYFTLAVLYHFGHGYTGNVYFLHATTKKGNWN